MLRVLLALAVALVGLQGVLSASRFHERNHMGLLFLYDFTEGQLAPPLPTEAQDATGRNLLGPMSLSTTNVLAWSPTQQGVSVTRTTGGERAVSQKNSSALLAQLTDEFTIELWFLSPYNLKSESLFIAGMGDWSAGSRFPVCDPSDTELEGGWRVYSTLGGIIHFSGVILRNAVPTCRDLSVSIYTDTLQHLVVRGQPGSLSMRSESNIHSTDWHFDPLLWARHAAPLLLMTPHSANAWTGSLHMIAMYNRYLSDAEITAHRNLGPPNSLPVAAVAAATTNQDEAVALVL